MTQSPATLQRIAVEQRGAIATVTLARPELRNAFDDLTIVELTGAFRALSDDASVRAIVLAAQGTAFCAGADLGYMQRMAHFSEAENRADAVGLATMLNTLYTCAKPVIARVQGDAYAGGLGLVAAADIAIAADGAQFCLSEARLGLLPATIAPYVIRAIGERAARRYVVSAERFDAREALRLGLVHDVVPRDALDASIERVAQAIAGNGPQAVIECKRLVRDIAGRPIDTALMLDTADRIARVRGSEEGRAGIASFLQKDSPPWAAR
ncbi:enoyl-CoA hydratase/isomerase family protein [Pararobbsia silviterrae]|uniref:Enoyl-CoA hydratase/isomerase family protein n=1 Tax=Pararobbsia silviterrae TaxID=1792498 RepID=A0A494YF74_9BURK|nr:enoyl-CoA hydratase/isomerase family protein [Pararobbsia silviterrae]RKP59378.1 enoyl-CoA hydratase/isomerase family protein [Pararobbsia silviterrae]